MQAVNWRAATTLFIATDVSAPKGALRSPRWCFLQNYCTAGCLLLDTDVNLIIRQHSQTILVGKQGTFCVVTDIIMSDCDETSVISMATICIAFELYRPDICCLSANRHRLDASPTQLHATYRALFQYNDVVLPVRATPC